MDNSLIASFTYFLGINNVDDPLHFAPQPIQTPLGTKSAYPLREALNVDIDNMFGISSRPGSDLQVSGSDIHSLWSDEKVCLFVDGPALYQLHEDYSVTQLLTGFPTGARMSYVLANDRIYMTNGGYIGYYHDLTMTALTDPGVTYKKALPAGQRIIFYRGRLYVASGNVLYIADPLCDHYDVRTGFIVFTNDITMLRDVDEGIYVADGETWFLSGLAPDEFQRIKVLDYDAIPFSDTTVNGSEIKEGLDGNYAMWVSTKGICLGSKKGQVKNLTADNYVMSTHGIGAAVLRQSDGVNHFIATLE